MFVIKKIFNKLDGSDITKDAEDIANLGSILKTEKEKFNSFVTVFGRIEGSMYTLEMIWTSKEEWRRYIDYITPLPFHTQWQKSLNHLLESRGITLETTFSTIK